MLELIDVLGDKLGLITSSEHMFEFANPHYDVNGNSSGVALFTEASDAWADSTTATRRVKGSK